MIEIGHSTKAVRVFVQAVLTIYIALIGGWHQAIAASEKNHDATYALVFDDIRRATDKGDIISFYNKSKEAYQDKKTVRNAVAWGMSYLTYRSLIETNLARAPQQNINYEEIRKALHAVMKRDTNSAYPILVYAHFVHHHREPMMPEAEYELLGYITVVDSKGVQHQARNERFVSDAPKEKRILELLAKARKIDPTNRFLLYLEARREKDASLAKENLWKSLETPGSKLWEFNALQALKTKSDGDSTTLQRINDWVMKAKKIVGNSPRAKARGF